MESKKRARTKARAALEKVTWRIPPELKHEIELLAGENGIAVNEMATRLLRAALAQRPSRS